MTNPALLTPLITILIYALAIEHWTDWFDTNIEDDEWISLGQDDQFVTYIRPLNEAVAQHMQSLHFLQPIWIN